MRDHSNHIELTREEAIAHLVDAAHFAPRTVTVGLHEAHMRVTAAECRAKVDVPNALCAQMDGIAVRFDDFADGMPDTSAWRLGVEYDWANTGTALPADYDCAIAIEKVEFDGGMGAVGVGEENPGTLRVLEAPAERFAKCRQAGATFKAGQLLLPAGTRLTPAKISALAMCGYSEIDVVAKPRVAFIPTGDELVTPGTPLSAGKAYDSNGVLLEGKMLLWGADPVVRDCIPDDWDAIRAAILSACEEADIVAINAGSSRGAKDFTMEILEEIGTVICHETNHGPGRHTSASVVNGTPVLGLSGPPSGCEITADWYLKPLVDSFLYGRIVPFAHAQAALGETGQTISPHKASEHSASKSDSVRMAEPGGQGSPGDGALGGPGRQSNPANGPGGQSKDAGPGKDFFAIRPVKLKRTDNGLVALPVSDGPHPDLLKLDEADGYLEMHPFALRSLSPGDEVTVELRYPYTTL